MLSSEWKSPALLKDLQASTETLVPRLSKEAGEFVRIVCVWVAGCAGVY